MTPSVGDIVVTPRGRYWRVLDVQQTIVRAIDLETGVVSHHDIETVTVIERHPGGPR